MTKLQGKPRPRIAILGWGSLLWDSDPVFDKLHGQWEYAGPVLPLEFSRVSQISRKGALTLVIDRTHGRDCQVAYAESTQRDPADAIADLRDREGTVMKHMGFWYADGSRTCAPEVPDGIPDWGTEKGFDVVVWTGLPGDFKKKTGKDFSIANAIAHLQGLEPEGKALAATYVWRAPPFVNTPLRDVLQTEPWFKPPDDAANR